MQIIIILISIGMGLARILGIKGEIFQALAHIWIGGLICACVIKPSESIIFQTIGLIVVELVCFFAMRKSNVN
jgi:hypothetical protein